MNPRLSKPIALCAVLILLGAGCTQPSKAKRVLEAAGYTQVEITGWRPWAAGEDDTFSTGFRAVGKDGSRVTGAVTGGWLKGSTIRVD